MILYMNLPLRYEGKVIFEYLTIIEKERLLRFGSRVTPLLLFCYYFSFNHDRTGRIFAVVDTARMRVNDRSIPTLPFMPYLPLSLKISFYITIAAGFFQMDAVGNFGLPFTEQPVFVKIRETPCNFKWAVLS